MRISGFLVGAAILLPALAHADAPVDAIENVNCSGTLTTNIADALTIDCNGDLSLQGGILSADSGISVTATGKLSIDSVQFSTAALELTAGGDLSVASDLVASGSISIVSTGGDITNGGNLTAGGSVSISATGGSISTGNVTISADSADLMAGNSLTAGGIISVASELDFTASAELSISNDTSISASTVNFTLDGPLSIGWNNFGVSVNPYSSGVSITTNSLNASTIEGNLIPESAISIAPGVTLANSGESVSVPLTPSDLTVASSGNTSGSNTGSGGPTSSNAMAGTSDPTGGAFSMPVLALMGVLFAVRKRRAARNS